MRRPEPESWLDHRLVCERHLDRCLTEALALNLFLVTVADAKGLSYYGDAPVCARLGVSGEQLDAARQALREAENLNHTQIARQLALHPQTVTHRANVRPGIVGQPLDLLEKGLRHV